MYTHDTVSCRYNELVIHYFSHEVIIMYNATRKGSVLGVLKFIMCIPSPIANTDTNAYVVQ